MPHIVKKLTTTLDSLLQIFIGGLSEALSTGQILFYWSKWKQKFPT